jgi:uncharacterized protein YceK
MIGRIAHAATFVALAMLSGGCGTLINQSSEPGQALYSNQMPPQLPYGGVLRDLAAPPSGIWQAATAGEDAGIFGRAQMVAAAVLIPPLDLPFSALADTVLLPFDLAHTLGRDSTDASPATNGPANAPQEPVKPSTSTTPR